MSAVDSAFFSGEGASLKNVAKDAWEAARAWLTVDPDWAVEEIVPNLIGECELKEDGTIVLDSPVAVEGKAHIVIKPAITNYQPGIPG